MKIVMTLFLPLVIAVSAMFLVACTGEGTPSVTPSPSAQPPPPPSCFAGDQAQYVYHPARLQVLSDCIKIKARVEFRKDESDKDVHIRGRLSPQDSASYLNAENDKQAGDLVIEPICQGFGSSQAAITACQGDNDPVNVSGINVGDCIEFEGAWVTDTVHGWNEIHPLGRWFVATTCEAMRVGLTENDFPDPGD